MTNREMLELAALRYAVPALQAEIEALLEDRDSLQAEIERLHEQQQRPPAVDDFVVTFRCESSGVVGTTTAKIHRVSRHDDGVIEVVIDHWPQQPATGEEIMVSTPYDVFILPLRPSGLDGNGPRFVVHVPGTEQPAPQAQSSTEAWRDLAIAGAAIVEEIREIVGLKGKPGDVVEAVREIAAALEAARGSENGND